MKKLLTISFILLGCGGSEFTTDIYSGLDVNASDASDSNSPATDSTTDSTTDSATDSATDSTTDSPVDEPNVDAPIEALTCFPGGEVVNNSCYYPEPECCYYMDCPSMDYSCSGGKCIHHTIPKECKDDSCQQWCVNCYVPGDKGYKGTCNGNTCECNEI